jgi:glycosyltransferase involved in cell wall biosynthesis
MAKETISVVIPAYNEAGNIVKLYEENKAALAGLVKAGEISGFEVIVVNDGSDDGMQEKLEALKKKEKNLLRVIEFRRNFGQTPAMRAGFGIAKGSLIVTMDGDLQNDSADIPQLLKKMRSDGLDVVTGWRHNRKDRFGKRIASKLMNALRKDVIGDELHDYGCSLKMYKRECLQDLELFGELHRFITAYLYIKGYKIGEVKVNHRQRHAGITKYNFSRGINGIMDLFFLKFWASYSDRPLHFFGRLGIWSWVIAVVLLIEQIVKAFIIGSLEFGPVLAFASLLVIMGGLVVVFGFVFEMLSRNHYKDKDMYSVRKVL